MIGSYINIGSQLPPAKITWRDFLGRKLDKALVAEAKASIASLRAAQSPDYEQEIELIRILFMENGVSLSL